MEELEVVCIRTEDNYPQLKIGKRFTITDEGISSCSTKDLLYKLISDDGEKVNWIEYFYFKPLSEWRNDKLKEIGI